MILEATNIWKVYTQTGSVLEVLKGINLGVKQGEIVSIVGPSGAGKSTLLHVLGGLDRPDRGSVQFDGEDMYRLSDTERAVVRNNKVGFIFQFYHLLPEFTALENVLLPRMIQMRYGKKREFEREASAILERVGLKGRLQHRSSQLSGGEQQRVAIARALINRPQVIFCDEPTGNLDSESGEGIIRLLIELNKNNGQTIVIVTHDAQVARQSHRIVHIKDGEINSR